MEPIAAYFAHDADIGVVGHDPTLEAAFEEADPELALVIGLNNRLAEAIGRLHADQSLSDLLAHAQGRPALARPSGWRRRGIDRAWASALGLEGGASRHRNVV